MKIRLALIASIACVAIPLAAHASDLSFNITGGTLSSSGSFSGSFLINTIGEVIDGGTFTVTAPSGGTVYSFFSNVASNPTIGGLEVFNDGKGDTFTLALHGGLTTLALNTLTSTPGGVGADTFLSVPGARFDATGGTITAASATTPEPSSLMLLGTGLLGLAGAFRRRFLNT